MPLQGQDVEREQTKQFIAQNPTSLVLTRNVHSPDNAGGYTFTPTPLTPQTVRVIPQNRSVSAARRNVSGEMVNPDYVVLCEWDADILPEDTFTYSGLKMEVIWVTVMSYEKVAEVSVV